MEKYKQLIAKGETEAALVKATEKDWEMPCTVEGLFQKFPFPATTNKYFKVKVLDVHGGSFASIPDIKLMGTLQ